MALTKLSSNEIQQGAITADLISADVALSMRIANVSIANSTYTVLDDTAVNVGGGYIVVTGAGFQSGCQVIVDETPATSTTFVSSTELRAQIGAKSAATYDLFVVNPDGGAAIRVNGITYSATPTWVTASALDNQAVDVAFNVAFDATGATSYANTTVLPAGTQLLSNGYFYGTITGITEETTYNFTVSAIDAENQDSPREFSVTVTVAPTKYLYVIGAGNNGVIGLNDIISRSSPVQIGSLGTWSKISSGFYHTIATKSDGTLWSWGNNNYGQLGLGDLILRSSPTQVGSSTDWADHSSGRFHCLATKTNNTLYVWGDNSNSQLGVDTGTAPRSSPTQVSGVIWNLVSASGYSSFATRTDGTAWSWGSNGTGQLGLNDVLTKNSPTQIGTGTDWSKIKPFFSGCYGIKTNGTLWSWGNNNGGQLGQNIVAINKSSPVQVGSDTNWTDVAAGEGQAMALRSDGTLWAIGGFNASGELGLNDTVRRSSPTQIGSGTNWTKISAGYNEYGAIKSDGTLWLWGYNGFGQLGQNERTNRSSPVQVSGLDWNDVYQGYFITYGTKSV